MNALDRQSRLMAVGLAAMAGMVDAIGFLASGGFFLSFMSGNSTRLSVGIASHATYVALVAALLGSFVAGVVSGSLVGRIKPVAASLRQAKILIVIAVLLFASPLIAAQGWLLPAICIAAFCMGAENTLYERDGTVSFGLTYMTGALVKIGQGIATWISGGERFAWLPYLQLWAGLIFGAVLGALLFARYGFFSLWVAAGLAAIFALMLLKVKRAA